MNTNFQFRINLNNFFLFFQVLFFLSLCKNEGGKLCHGVVQLPFLLFHPVVGVSVLGREQSWARLWSSGDRTRGNGSRLCLVRFRVEIVGNDPTGKLVRYWTRLPRGTNAGNVQKACGCGAQRNAFVLLNSQLDLMILKVFCNLNDSVILLVKRKWKHKWKRINLLFAMLGMLCFGDSFPVPSFPKWKLKSVLTAF